VEPILLFIAFLVPSTDEIKEVEVPVVSEEACHFTAGALYSHIRAAHHVSEDAFLYNCLPNGKEI